MSALESGNHVASVTKLPSRAVDSPAPVPAVPVESGPSLAQRAADLIVPPDVWSDDRPALRKLDLYARYGRWTQAEGVLRVLGTGYAYLAMGLTAVLYTLAWIVERPSRFLVAATVAALLIIRF